jgi:hypothetical protein
MRTLCFVRHLLADVYKQSNGQGYSGKLRILVITVMCLPMLTTDELRMFGLSLVARDPGTGRIAVVVDGA